MKSEILVFVLAFLATQVSASVVKDPRDLAQEALEQLKELQSIVQGEIIAAHNDLEEIEYDFLAYANNIQTEAIISIQQEQETIEGQINTIKNLAASANRDISSCTDIREELLGRLPGQYQDELRSCITEQNKEETLILANAKYIVDVSINKVHNLEFQLSQCRGELLCISPLVTEIQLDKLSIPQNIRTEVNSAESLVDILRLSVQHCSTSAVSEYTSEASAILQDLIDCANRILG